MSAGFSTADVDPADGVDHWRAMVRRHFVPLDVQPLVAHGFAGSASVRSLEGLEIARLSASSMAVTRTHRHIRHSAADEYFVALHVRGIAAAEHNGQRIVMRPGDLALFDSARPYRIEFRNAGPVEHLVFRFPRERLDAHGRGLDRAVGMCVAAGSDAGLLAGGYLGALATLTSAQAHVASATAVVAAALRDAAGLGEHPPAPRDVLLAEIKAYVLARLGDGDLAPPDVARAHHISTRGLHRLFAADERSFAQYVREQRLLRCRRELADPRLIGVSIAQIARRGGFVSPAHFTRAFTRRFGTHPREWRAQANRLAVLRTHSI